MPSKHNSSTISAFCRSLPGYQILEGLCLWSPRRVGVVRRCRKLLEGKDRHEPRHARRGEQPNRTVPDGTDVNQGYGGHRGDGEGGGEGPSVAVSGGGSGGAQEFIPSGSDGRACALMSSLSFCVPHQVQLRSSVLWTMGLCLATLSVLDHALSSQA